MWISFTDLHSVSLITCVLLIITISGLTLWPRCGSHALCAGPSPWLLMLPHSTRQDLSELAELVGDNESFQDFWNTETENATAGELTGASTYPCADNAPVPTCAALLSVGMPDPEPKCAAVPPALWINTPTYGGLCGNVSTRTFKVTTNEWTQHTQVEPKISRGQAV